uniref:Uncharacterized protein n=1 Tax=Arundo donax TaxID=35708 RepID=A0A0A9CHN3_ARUDO
MPLPSFFNHVHHREGEVQVIFLSYFSFWKYDEGPPFFDGLSRLIYMLLQPMFIAQLLPRILTAKSNSVSYLQHFGHQCSLTASICFTISVKPRKITIF